MHRYHQDINTFSDMRIVVLNLPNAVPFNLVPPGVVIPKHKIYLFRYFISVNLLL